MSYQEERVSDLRKKPVLTVEESKELSLWNELAELTANENPTQEIRRCINYLIQQLDEYAFAETLRVLAENGYVYTYMAELNANAAKLSGEAIELMIEILSHTQYDFVLKGLLHCIANTRRVYNATGLACLYDGMKVNDPLRWDIGSAISRSNAKGIESWVREKLTNPDSGNGWFRLTEYAARRFPYEEAVRLLKPLAKLTPANIALALGICGRQDEIAFLNQMVQAYNQRSDGEIRQNIKRAISKIKNRLSKQNR